MEISEGVRSRHKWTSAATNLLISIWSHDKVQNQLLLSSRNLPIWQSIARYLSRKGFDATGGQCRTRIKNMLSTYQEAVRKKDRSLSEPFYDIFQKVEQKKKEKKKGGKLNKPAQEELESSDSNDQDMEFEPENSQTEQEYQIEYLDTNPVETSTPTNIDMTQLEKIITKAVEAQTKTITATLRSQTQLIGRLLTSERERLEIIMASERESRMQLEAKFDKLLSKMEAPQLAYIGPVIERQS